MPYEFYKIMHIVGIFMLFLSYGGWLTNAFAGRGKTELPGRKIISATHGVGLLLALVGGFGLIAKLGIGWPKWVLVKVVIWLVLGGLMVFIYKKPQTAKTLWPIMIVIGFVAAYLAVMKPF